MESDVTTLGDHAARLRGRWLSLLALTILGAAAGWGLSQTQETLYSAETKVLASPGAATDIGAPMDPEQVATQAEVVLSDPVVDRVMANLSFKAVRRDLLDSTSVEPSEGTNVLVITTEQDTPGHAVAVANGFAKSYLEARMDQTGKSLTFYRDRLAEVEAQVADLRAALPDQPQKQRVKTRAVISSLRSRQSDLQAQLIAVDLPTADAGQEQVLQSAAVPQSPSQPRPVWDAALGGVFGLLLGVLLAYVRTPRYAGYRWRRGRG